MANVSKSAGVPVSASSPAVANSSPAPQAPLRGRSSGIRAAVPARARSTPPTVRITHPGGLSYYTVTTTPRGRYLSSCAFDVPAQSYTEGWTTGQRAAAEFMQALQNGTEVDVLGTIVEAGKARSSMRMQSDEPCRVGAATGFLRTIEHGLRFAAMHWDHQADIGEEIGRLAALKAEREARERSKGKKAAKAAPASRDAQSGGAR